MLFSALSCVQNAPGNQEQHASLFSQIGAAAAIAVVSDLDLVHKVMVDLETDLVLALYRTPPFRLRPTSSPRALDAAVRGPASSVQRGEVLHIPPELGPNRLW